MLIYEIDPCRDPRWRTLVESHPGASVFHTPGWLEALRRTYSYEPRAITTCPPDTPLTNGIVYCHINSWLTGSRLVSLPFSDHCEPLVERREELRALLNEVEQKAALGYKYAEIRPRSGGLQDQGGFRIAARYHLHTLDLRPGPDELFSRFHKDSVQRKIRRAERDRLEFAVGRSESLLRSFYQLTVLTRRRQQLPPQPLEWFQNLISCLGDSVEIYVASKEGQAIAAIFTIRHRNVLTYKYGCSDARFHPLGGMHLLFWNAIRKAHQQGLSEMDFGRTDVSNAGLSQFKDRWGTHRRELVYFRFPARALPAPTRSISGVAGKLVQWLPQRALVSLGRLVYRHFG